VRDARKIRLPGFIVEGEVGLGEAIKRATRAVGIPPCGGCQRRAHALDQRAVFSGPSDRGRPKRQS
jgi:hypothetical protein